MLNKITSVQECDATADATKTAVGSIKIILIILLTLTIFVYKKTFNKYLITFWHVGTFHAFNKQILQNEKIICRCPFHYLREIFLCPNRTVFLLSPGNWCKISRRIFR